MKDISEIFGYSQNKTRVLVYSSHPSVTKLLIQVLDFHGKDFDFFFENGFSKNSENDFVILETSDSKKASDFQPNIVLISDEISSEKAELILPNIISGGILIYAKNIENAVENTENYFRKLLFTESEFRRNGDSYVLTTEIGSIPLISNDENLIKNINGIKLLCQQFGVMRDEFYEPVMSFEEDLFSF